MKENIYFGTYTKKSSQGIYRATFDPTTGTLSTPQPVVAVENPTYLTISPDNTLLTIAKEGPLGGIAAYDPSQDSYALLADALTEEPNPCYIAYDQKRHFIYTANYHTGQIKVYQFDNDKALTLCDTVTHKGYGPRHEQDSAHIHYTDLTPDGRLVAVDLGNDTITTYDVTETGKLKFVAVLKTKPGLGPRHLVFAPDNETAYLVGELSSTLSTLHYDKNSGTFALLNTVSTIPENWGQHNGAAAIKISQDGHFVYVSNRGHDSVAVFDVTTKKPQLLQLVDTKGAFPRDFALDLTDKFLVVANQETDNISVYQRDQAQGTLTLLSQDIPLPEGVCVYFDPTNA